MGKSEGQGREVIEALREYRRAQHQAIGEIDDILKRVHELWSPLCGLIVELTPPAARDLVLTGEALEALAVRGEINFKLRYRHKLKQFSSSQEVAKVFEQLTQATKGVLEIELKTDEQRFAFRIKLVEP